MQDVRQDSNGTGGKKEHEESQESSRSILKKVFREQLIMKGPPYANNFFFTIGVYLLLLFAVLVVTGIIMLIFGPYWWDLTSTGTFFRSVHLWAAEAFVTLMFLHLFVNFCTSAFRKKRLMWMIGSVMLMLVLLEFAFGVGFGGSLYGQVNEQAGADLWNGMGLGYWINPMNEGAVFGWHVAILPMLLAALMFLHYSIVRKQGLNAPYRSDVPSRTIPINHTMMYKRMAYVLAVVLLFAIVFRAPFVPPLTIGQVAQAHPDATALTFLSEFNRSSPTATYLDTINPYNFSTRTVYISIPYDAYLDLSHSSDAEQAFLSETLPQQNRTMAQAASYFSGNGTISNGMNSSNPMIKLASSLTYMAQTGVYQPMLQSEVASGMDTTYVIRFLFDTGALWGTAEKYGLNVSQWGMLEVGPPPWYLQYWLLPYNFLQIETSAMPWWGDLGSGSVALLAFFLLFALPYIPGLRAIPDRLKLYKLFWNRFTIPEMRSRAKNRNRKRR